LRFDAGDVGPNPVVYRIITSPGFAGLDAPGYKPGGPKME